MKSPQKENGYTPIANEILEVISKCKLNGTQFRILTVVWRYTYGFSRKEHELGVNFLVNATGISKRQIQKELNELMSSKILIEVRPASFNSTRIISFNKNYDEWKLDTSTPNKQQVNEKGGDEQKDTSTGELLDTSTGDKKDTSTGELLDTQERNIKAIYKTNIKQEEEKANPFTFFENNGFGTISSFMSQELCYWLDSGFFDEPEEIVVEAMKEALKAGAKRLNYITKCLKDWKDKKFRTLKDVQANNKQYESNKQNKTWKGNGENGKNEDAKAWLEKYNIPF